MGGMRQEGISCAALSGERTMTNRKKFILIMSFILLCGGCAKEDASTPELSSEKDTEEMLTTSVLEVQTDVPQEEQEGFFLCYDGKDTGGLDSFFGLCLRI